MPLALLVSCGQDPQAGLTLFKSRYDNGEYFEELCKSETDDTKVYMTTIAVSNHREDAVKFTVSDFKMSFEGKTYSPIFFVLSRQSSSITINGVMESHYYVSESATECSIPVAQGMMENLSLTFETSTQSDFKLEYKDTEISSI